MSDPTVGVVGVGVVTYLDDTSHWWRMGDPTVGVGAVSYLDDIRHWCGRGEHTVGIVGVGAVCVRVYVPGAILSTLSGCIG